MRTPGKRVRLPGIGVISVDPQMAMIVRAMNRLPGLLTNSSCEGHAKPGPGQSPAGRWCVSFEVDESPAGWQALGRVARVAMELEACRVVVWSDGGVRFELEGAMEYTTPDRFAQALARET